MNERVYWLAWSQIPGLGAVLLTRLRAHCGDLEAAWHWPLRELGAVEGIGDRGLSAIARARQQLDPRAFHEQYRQRNPQFLTPADADYPQLLQEIPGPPPVLHWLGNLDLIGNRRAWTGVAVVGTRDPTPYACRWTEKLTCRLARSGFTILSGMAYGIDTEAHRACLAVKGETVAVLGTGIDVCYPSTNEALYDRIRAEGLLLSEYPAGTGPQRGHFPARNRIVAGLSRAVLVTEAPSRSGALITARLANEFGRDVFVLPGSLDNPAALGCLGLLVQGAQPVLGEGHLLELLGRLPDLDPPAEQLGLNLTPPLPPELEPVLRRIPPEPIALERLVLDTGLEAGQVAAALMQLELLGRVQQLPGMQVQRI